MMHDAMDNAKGAAGTEGLPCGASDPGDFRRLRFQSAVGHYDLPRDARESFFEGGSFVLPVDRWLLRRLLNIMGDPPLEIKLWNGESITTAPQPSAARILIKRRSTLWRVISNPGLNFGDAYSAGDIEVEGDLIRFLELTYNSGTDLERRWGMLRRAVDRMGRGTRTASLRTARENIHRHYDIGNDFYRLWLDEDMVYTCAYYPTPEAGLEEAQQGKMHHVCRKLRLAPGETVIEAGCGWGSLARFMARHYGVKVKAMNISHEQIVYAREAARREGLDDRVEFIEDDYRNIRGSCDVFVSVGMLEHVGRDNYGALGTVIDRCLHKRGRGLLHSIGRNRPCAMNSWIDRRIFPGAYPPALAEMVGILEPWNFAVIDIENIRLHYARTLMHWLERYERHFTRVVEMYDMNFARAWRLYLAGSIAAFTSGALQLFQMVFTRSGLNDVPWTRAHLYADRP